MFKLKRRKFKGSSSRASRSSRQDNHSQRSDGSSTVQSTSFVLKSCFKSSNNSVRSRDTHPSNNSSVGSENTAPKKVQFQHVRFKEYERIIGDNPSCSSGAPVGIGWACTSEKIMGLDEYEKSRPARKQDMELVLTRQDREEILIEWGANFNQIIDAIRSTIKAKNQRRNTVNNLGRYDRWEEAMETAGRKLKRTLLLQNRSVPKYTQASMGYTQNGSPTSPPKVPTRVEVDHSNEFHHQDSNDDAKSASDESDQGVQSLRGKVISEPSSEEQLRSLENYKELSSSSLRPDPLIPLHEVEVRGEADDLSEYTNFYSYVTGNSYATIDSQNDGFEYLTRDQSYWEVQGRDHPKIHRKMTTIVISEDGSFDDPTPMDPIYMGGWQHGYVPPPYSDSIISRWH